MKATFFVYDFAIQTAFFCSRRPYPTGRCRSCQGYLQAFSGSEGFSCELRAYHGVTQQGLEGKSGNCFKFYGIFSISRKQRVDIGGTVL